MTSFFLGNDAAARRPIVLGDAIAEGGVGTIHRVLGETGQVVKLYKDPKELPVYREKVAAMLAAPPALPPFSDGGRSYVQIAWPTAAVSDAVGGFRGFAMPEVDFSTSSELENILQRSTRQRKQLPEFYGIRVLLAANLAALLEQLHGLGHYMVDMKPANLRFYPDNAYLAIIDTDGFSIGGPRRFPARQFSDDYIAPEARAKRPEELGLDEDLFALAVIIFQLLNNGVHPFQGVDRDGTPRPTTLQERIFAGLYAYGRVPQLGVRPSPASIHETFEDETRALFDQAFARGASRPSAGQWHHHLRQLIADKVLVKCAANPGEHAHFSKGCGLCALDRRVAVARAAQPMSIATRSVADPAPPALSNAPAVPSGGPRWTTLGAVVAVGATLLIVIGILVTVLIEAQHREQQPQEVFKFVQKWKPQPRAPSGSKIPDPSLVPTPATPGPPTPAAVQDQTWVLRQPLLIMPSRWFRIDCPSERIWLQGPLTLKYSPAKQVFTEGIPPELDEQACVEVGTRTFPASMVNGRFMGMVETPDPLSWNLHIADKDPRRIIPLWSSSSSATAEPKAQIIDLRAGSEMTLPSKWVGIDCPSGRAWLKGPLLLRIPWANVVDTEGKPLDEKACLAVGEPARGSTLGDAGGIRLEDFQKTQK